MDSLIDKIKSKLPPNFKKFALPLIGIAGIILIGLSSCQDNSDTNQVITKEDSTYCTELEGKISQLVAAITGDKNCVVAVTLENGNEYIYADQNTLDTDQSEDTGEDGTTTRETQKSKQEYIIVEGQDGVQTALIVTERKPAVRGVAIVSGGLSDYNKEQVLSSVSSMLGISSRKINISQKAE